MKHYLSSTEVAHRIDIEPASLRALKSLPEPDAMIGRARSWMPSAIDKWDETRIRGRGLKRTNNNS